MINDNFNYNFLNKLLWWRGFDPIPKHSNKCESYVDHNVVWAGDGYICAVCGLEFVPKPKPEERCCNNGYFGENHKCLKSNGK